ncbi:MAG: acetylglutamate kinase [Crocinitomix sp.]|jgi:acetylglutamate kinase
MKNKLSILKIGGNVIEDEQKLETFLNAFKELEGVKVLVHGGGKKATALSDQLGVETKMHKGRRITSQENLEIITMVYAGLINKMIVAKLQANKCNALGLSGADGNSITAVKRSVVPIDFGFVGDVKKVNDNLINLLLSNAIIPVFCALSHDNKGQLLNTNADTIAAEIAISMSDKYDTELIYCFDKKGVLNDVNKEDSVITKMNSSDFKTLKENGKVHDGMLPKLTNAFYALENGVKAVCIQHYGSIGFPEPNGTTITL